MIELRTLGSLDLRDGDGRDLQSVVVQTKRFALLTYLAVALPDGFHRREQLLALFWPESDSDHAHRALRQSLYFLRRSLGDGVVVNRGDEEVGLDRRKLNCDACRFREAIERGEVWRAVALYAGPFLEACSVHGSPELEDWIETERDGLRREYLRALERVATEHGSEGNHAGAVTSWRKLVSHNAYSTEYARGLMEALAVAGDPIAAVKHAESHVALVREEFDTDPDPEITALADRIRNGKITPQVITEPRYAVPTLPPPDDDAPPGSPPEPLPSNPRTRWSRPVPYALVAAGILGLLAIIGTMGEREPSPVVPEICESCVAVFPFRVMGHDSLVIWGEGVARLLSQDLDGAGAVRVVDPNAVIAGLDRVRDSPIHPDSASILAQRLRARWLILGSLLDLGDRVRVSGSLYRVGDGIPSAVPAPVDGTMDEVAFLSSRLALEFISHLPLGDGMRLADVSSIRTDNYVALKAYVGGELHARHKEVPEAIEAFERAVQADSSFGLARYRLMFVRSWFSHTQGHETAKATFPYRSQLSGSDSLLFEGYHAFATGQPARMDSVLAILVNAYPSNPEGWYVRGHGTLFYAWQTGRSPSEARAYYRRALEIDPGYPPALRGLSRVAYWDGDWQQRDSLGFAPYQTSVYWDLNTRVIRAFHTGDARAQEEVIAVLRREASAETVRDIAARLMASDALQHPEGARRVAALLTDSSRTPRAQLIGYLHLAHLAVATGRWSDAASHFEHAAVFAPRLSLVYRSLLSTAPQLRLDDGQLAVLHDRVSRWDGKMDSVMDVTPTVDGTMPYGVPDDIVPHIRTYLLGLLSARLGEYTAASRYAGDLREAVSPRDTFGLVHDLAVDVEAFVQFSRGDVDSALAVIETQKFGYWTRLYGLSYFYLRPFGRLLRGEILYAAGRRREAVKWFSTFAWARAPDWVYSPHLHLRRGQIFEDLGENELAVQYYARFVNLWWDADPERQTDLTWAIARLGALDSDISEDAWRRGRWSIHALNGHD